MATAAMAMKGMHRLFEGGTLAGRSDAQLIEAFLARRDESAFAGLVARHGPMVLATCRAVLRDASAADDAFQATFLVLARKAASVRGRDALGGWLHRVAYRTAVQATRDAARRRVEERKAAEMRATASVRDEIGDDLRASIHAEVERLPESLRLPVVLCDLGGLTREQAADELRWTEWMVRGRLTRGREKLRTRLAVRGLAPTGGVVTAMLAREASAAVPEVLASVTVRSAVASVGGIASASSAAALAGRAIRAMGLSRLKAAALALTAAAVAGGSAGLVLLAAPQKKGDGQMPAMMKKATPPADRKEMAKPADAARPTPEEASKWASGLLNAIRGGKEKSYRGAVVSLEGKPVGGAKVYMLNAGLPMTPLAASGPDGRFDFKAMVGPGTTPRVVAEAEGYALGGASKGFARGDLLSGPPDDGLDLTVKLVEDQAVEGRVVDLEGRPVVGATVRGEFLFVPKSGDLGPYLAALKAQEDSPDQLRNKYLGQSGFASLRQLTTGDTATGVSTDAQGRFVLKGVGRDRLVHLKVEAPTIRPIGVEVITRAMEPIRVPNWPGEPRFGTRTFYGASPRLAASPTRPIEGLVRDRATGAPIVGATVSSYKLADQDLGNNTIVQAKSDARGRYRLAGMPRGQGNEVMVIPPAGSPHLPAFVRLDDPPGLGPIALDIPMARGVMIEGRVVDDPDGKPVQAWVTYHVPVDSPALDAAPSFRQMQYAQSYMLKATTDPRGKFKLVGLPGRGALVVETIDRSHPSDGQQGFRQDFIPVVQMFHQALAEVDIPKDARSFAKEIRLDPGRVVEGTVVDPDGKPLEGAEVYGLHNLGGWTNLPGTSTFKAVSLVPARGMRALVFRHEGRKLAGWVEVRGDEKERPRVRLEPWASATGRLLDPDGKAREGVVLKVYADKPRLGGGTISHEPESIRTDADGRFRVDGLAPGVAYKMYVQSVGGMRAEKPVEIPALKPGESRDLGTVPVVYRERN